MFMLIAYHLLSWNEFRIFYYLCDKFSTNEKRSMLYAIFAQITIRMKYCWHSYLFCHDFTFTYHWHLTDISGTSHYVFDELSQYCYCNNVYFYRALVDRLRYSRVLEIDTFLVKRTWKFVDSILVDVAIYLTNFFGYTEWLVVIYDRRARIIDQFLLLDINCTINKKITIGVKMLRCCWTPLKF